jgi:hypothetical protein
LLYDIKYCDVGTGATTVYRFVYIHHTRLLCRVSTLRLYHDH